ncbi:hypothetical protein OKA04_22065 [Luteolibacter flavescens]|uniref:Uncharacterized protein n=1 Tax=Luteolibacter flavescens TaxID=1859460 RepID=A0ABT3FV38_9BACT|nr:hypothetical protein [Luteolibacter flavescens]MCW1887438.1 hypothetical protein [Luteolibacter flavescens]
MSITLPLKRLMACLATISGICLADPIGVGEVRGFTPGIHGAVELVFQSEVGKHYQIQISSDLATWDNEGYSVKGTGGEISVLARTRNLPNAYYRLRDDGSPDNVAPLASVTAGAIAAAGGALADFSNVDATTGLAALGAQSNRVTVLERFGRLPEGTVIGPGHTPEIGEGWRWHHLGGSAKPYIENGALRAVPGSVYYLGRSVDEGITSLSTVIEWRPSASYPSGLWTNGFTIGLAPSNMINEDGRPVTLPVDMLHLRFDRSGIAAFELGNGGVNFTPVVAEGATRNYVNWGPTNQFWMQFQRQYLLNIELDTVKHECRITALGKTWKFSHPRIGASGPYTDFFLEGGGDTQGAATYDGYVAVHSAWVNSPQLDQTPGLGVMPYNDALASLSTGAIGQLLMTQLKLPGAVSGVVAGEQNSDRLVVGGDAYIHGKLSANTGNGRGRVPVMIQTLSNTWAPSSGGAASGGTGAPLVSTASQIDGAMLQFYDTYLPNNGDSITYEIRGKFGANGNTKRLRIESAGIGYWFDSGSLTENGTSFVLRVTRTKTSSSSHVLDGEFLTSDAKVIMGSSHNPGGATNAVLRISGTAAGDVTVHSIVGIYHPSGI